MSAFGIAFRNIRRTPYQTTASLLVMVLTFFLLLLFLITSYGLNRILHHFETLPKVLACLTEDATEDDAKAIDAQVRATGNIAESRIIYQEEALNIFRDRWKEVPEITEFVQKDFLPICIDIKTKKLEDLESTAQVLRSFDKLDKDKITFPKDEIKALLSWTKGLRLFGLVITLYAMITSIFTILIVIGMKIAAKRDEIEILKLLGATPWYIRAPFLVEGMFYGVVGSVAAWLLGLIPFLYLQQPLQGFFSGDGFAVFPNVPVILGVLLVIQVANGLIVGLIGSFISLWRYMK